MTNPIRDKTIYLLSQACRREGAKWAEECQEAGDINPWDNNDEYGQTATVRDVCQRNGVSYDTLTTREQLSLLDWLLEGFKNG